MSIDDFKSLMDGFDPASLLPELDTILGSLAPICRVAVLPGPVLMLFFGLLSFLLSAFWGSNLVVGEQVGEMISSCLILTSIAFLAPYNFKVMGLCAVSCFAYYVICFGMLDIRTMANMVFISFMSSIVWLWFFVLGTHANKGSEHSEPDQGCFDKP